MMIMMMMVMPRQLRQERATVSISSQTTGRRIPFAVLGTSGIVDSFPCLYSLEYDYGGNQKTTTFSPLSLDSSVAVNQITQGLFGVDIAVHQCYKDYQAHKTGCLGRRLSVLGKRVKERVLITPAQTICRYFGFVFLFGFLFPGLQATKDTEMPN